MAVRDVSDPSFTSRKCTVNRPPLWEATKNKNFGCLADGEAALPPYERLHCALEVMGLLMLQKMSQFLLEDHLP